MDTLGARDDRDGGVSPQGYWRWLWWVGGGEWVYVECSKIQGCRESDGGMFDWKSEVVCRGRGG